MQTGNSSLLDAKLSREALHGPVAVILTDALGKITWCNASAENLFDVQLAKIGKRSVADLLDKDPPQNSRPDNLCSIRSKQGQVQYVLHHEVMRPTGGAHYFVEANELAMSLQKLKDSEAMTRYALEASGHAVWDFKAAPEDGGKESAYYSDNWRAMRGMTEEEAAKDHYELWLARIHPDDLAHVIENVALQDTGVLPELSYEYRERHKNGHYIWILARGKVCKIDDCGKPSHIVGVDVDITEIKQAEAKQKESTNSIFNQHFAELENARKIAEEAAFKAQAWHEALDTIGHGVWSHRIWHENDETKSEPLNCSNRWYEMRGLSPEETAQQAPNAWKSRVHPDDYPEAIAQISRQHQGLQDIISFEYRERHALGHWIWILCKGRAIEKDSAGRPTYTVGIDIDITDAKNEEERRSAEAKKLYDDHVAELTEERRTVEAARLRLVEIAQRESIWRTAVDATGNGVWSYNIIRDGDDATTVVNYCSDAWYAIRGVEPGNTQIHELEAFYDRVHPKDLAILTDSIEKQIDGSEDEVSFEYRERHTNGRWIWILARGRTVERDEHGRASRVVGIDIDITQLKAESAMRAHETAKQHQIHIAELQSANDLAESAQKEAQAMARLDMQTELANRRMFRETVTTELEAKRPFAVMIIDLDHFKKINDLHGHAAGDFVLRETAARLTRAVDARSTLVARLGGDEFAIVVKLPRDGSTNSVGAIAEKIIRDLKVIHHLGELVLEVGATIGSACCPCDGDEYDLLMHRADMALYHAKAQNRGRHHPYTAELGENAKDRELLENDLRAAIAQNQIEPWFQPILAANSDRIAKFEVLARWQHPTRGFVPPDRFIEIADYLGLLPTLTTNLLRKACTFARDWSPVKLSFNISAGEASDPATPLHLLNTLQQSGFDPRRLEIEITEQAFLNNLEFARSVVSSLRQVGIKVYVDDFGAGYAGISYLRDLEVDGIKFDRSCVTEVCNKPAAAVFLKSLQLMASTMNLETVAEGIETPDVWDLVKSLKCDFGQGYLFSKAKPATEIAKLFVPAKAPPAASIA